MDKLSIDVKQCALEALKCEIYMKELIVDRSGITCEICDDSLSRLEGEKKRFMDWLSNVESSPYMFTTTLIGIKKSCFEFDRALDDKLFSEIVSHHDNAYDFYINPTDIGEDEDKHSTIYNAIFVLLVLNYEDVREKIKTVKDKLGGQVIRNVEDDFTITFEKS